MALSWIIIAALIFLAVLTATVGLVLYGVLQGLFRGLGGAGRAVGGLLGGDSDRVDAGARRNAPMSASVVALLVASVVSAGVLLVFPLRVSSGDNAATEVYGTAPDVEFYTREHFGGDLPLDPVANPRDAGYRPPDWWVTNEAQAATPADRFTAAFRGLLDRMTRSLPLDFIHMILALGLVCIWQAWSRNTP